MKYKLIKEYPNSPKLGTVIYEAHNTLWEYERPNHEFRQLSLLTVQNSPEYWSPETEWISQLSNSPKGSLHWLNTLLGRVARIGEHLTKQPQTTYLTEYGKCIEEDVREVMDYFQDKIK